MDTRNNLEKQTQETNKEVGTKSAEMVQKELNEQKKPTQTVQQNMTNQDNKQTVQPEKPVIEKKISPETQLPSQKITIQGNQISQTSEAVQKTLLEEQTKAPIQQTSPSTQKTLTEQMIDENKTAPSRQTLRNAMAQKFVNPYARAVIQPALTGAAIGVSFFPINAFIVGLQNRPPGTSPYDYFKGLAPKVAPNQSVLQAVKDMLWMNSRYIGRGVKYSCTTSFTKSIFTCNGPMVQKHIEHDFGMFYGKDVQDPTIHSEQSSFRTPYNRWFVTGGISTVLGLTESGLTSNTAAKATCTMLKKDIQVIGLINNATFAPGGLTRSCKSGFGQFAFLGTEHIADFFKIYFPEKNYGFLPTGISAGLTGFVGGGVGTLFDNLYTQQLSGIKQVRPNKYTVPNIIEVGSYIYKDIGLKGFARGAIPNMMTMPAIFLIAQGINEWFNKQEAKFKKPPSHASNGFTFFRSRECSSQDAGPTKQAAATPTKVQETKEVNNIRPKSP